MYKLVYQLADKTNQEQTFKNLTKVRQFILKNDPELWQVFYEDQETVPLAHNNLQSWGYKGYLPKLDPEKESYEESRNTQ
jgi:hypothetical protein